MTEGQKKLLFLSSAEWGVLDPEETNTFSLSLSLSLFLSLSQSLYLYLYLHLCLCLNHLSSCQMRLNCHLLRWDFSLTEIIEAELRSYYTVLYLSVLCGPLGIDCLRSFCMSRIYYLSSFFPQEKPWPVEIKAVICLIIFPFGLKVWVGLETGRCSLHTEPALPMVSYSSQCIFCDSLNVLKRKRTRLCQCELE